MAPAFWAAGLGVALVAAAPAMADEAPKYGGILTYMIPADAPPSFDAHREGTLRDRAFGRALLQRADPSRSKQTVIDDRLRLRSVCGDAAADRQRQGLHLQDS